MRVPWRGLLALSLLAGFFVLAVGIVLGLFGLALWLMVNHHGSLVVWLAAIGMSAVLVKAVRAALVVRIEPQGAPLTERDQPALWREIHELAVLAGTRPPDDVRLTAVVNAGVWEEPRLLGLRAGERHLEIGLPLLALTVGELRAVLAHELGHYGRGHRVAGHDLPDQGRAAADPRHDESQPLPVGAAPVTGPGPRLGRLTGELSRPGPGGGPHSRAPDRVPPRCSS